MKIHFSIVTYTSNADTHGLVEELGSQLESIPELRESRIFVKSNDGRPLHRSILLASPRVVEVPETDNVGFGPGHQLTYRQLDDGTWLWILNPDLRVPDRWVRDGLTHLAQVDPMVALVGVPIAGEPPSIAARPSGVQALAFVFATFGGRRLTRKFRQGSGGCYAVNGAAFAIRKTPRIPEPFDPDVFLFYEEWILAEKVFQAELAVAILDELPPLVHSIGGSRASRSRLVDVFVESQQHYLRNYLHWSSPIVRILSWATRIRLSLSGGA